MTKPERKIHWFRQLLDKIKTVSPVNADIDDNADFFYGGLNALDQGHQPSSGDRKPGN